MSDKISPNNNYIVNNVTSINTATNILRRPYANTAFTPKKKGNKSNSFKKTLKHSNSDSSLDKDSNSFSELLIDELNNPLKLKNNEQSRIIRSNFQNESLINPSTNNTNFNKTSDNTELHAKLGEAMKIEVDTSALCEKIELLNSLRK
jgi:hypothetical protein